MISNGRFTPSQVSIDTVSGERESDVHTQQPNYGSKHLEE